MHFWVLPVFLIFSFSDALHWVDDLQEARLIAQRENRLILLVFSGSDWCRNCMLFKREVLDSEGFASIADEKLVLLNADFPRNTKNQLSEIRRIQNEKLARKFNPQGEFPKIILIDNQETILGESGYSMSSRDEFLTRLKGWMSK